MITVAIGVGLKQVNQARNSVESENFMLETSMILDDVTRLLKETKELDLIVKNDTVEGSIDALSIFLAQTGFIPFESSGVKIILELSSARAKFNPNALVDENSTLPVIERVNALKNYMSEKNVDAIYVNMMLDIMSKEREDGSYNSDIFSEKPLLFRDYITSREHLREVDDSYLKSYRNSAINDVDFEKLFYFSKDRNSSIDLNYATVDVWQMMLKCDLARAEKLNEDGGFYTKIEDLHLSPDEKIALSAFNVSFFEPYLDVKVEIIKGKNNAKIRFEYDMKEKKGSNFVYEI
jgi:hypothetical protein